MSNMTSDSDERMISTDCINSPIDEATTERNMMGNGTLKKGPWTSAEDAILVDYVHKHGEGNWNAVQKHSGLSRCGKSCRLRWANHLRPDLKKGAFTPEEERRIIELHAKMGNKWARMAVELPGRTDNEIKNFWNTRTKRRQRAGLPIYPADVCLQTLNENTQNQNMVTFTNGDTSHPETMQTNNFQIPAVEFKNLDLYDLPGDSFHNMLPPGFGTTTNSLLFPISHPPKRIRRSEPYIYDGGGGGGGLNDIFPAVNVYQDSSTCLFSGSHAVLNGNNTSSCDPNPWVTKMELPSLQYSTQMGSSCNAPSSPLPSLESVDTLIQSALIGCEKTDSPSRRNSGLLEAVLYESQTLKMSKSSNTSVLPRDVTDSSSQNPQDDWEGYEDAMSPLGHSAASVFSEYTPHISGSSLDEHQSVEIVSVKHETDESGGKQSEREDEKYNHINYSRPDFLLGSNWFGSGSNNGLSEPVSSILGEDLCNHLPFLGEDESGKWDDISEICTASGIR